MLQILFQYLCVKWRILGTKLVVVAITFSLRVLLLDARLSIFRH